MILHQVDAFTERAFAGNPAAVCVMDGDRPEAWKQAVAEEMNLSETAFVRPDTREGHWALQWFTPAAEVELCGHATLAAAHVLWDLGRVPKAHPIRFRTRYRGVLTCVQDAAGRLAMDFPADPPRAAEAPGGLAEAVGVNPVATLRSSYDWLLELADEQAVRAAEPNWLELAEFQTRGVLITARGGESGADVVSRFFAPRLRINEDPVTGSAHCVLGPYWSERLGKASLRCFQASARGGWVEVTVQGDRVQLAGRAVTVLRGELTAL